ncbi:tRNA (adenosine(37)-N6)-threonylcarbamoyltransferase complex dimerization subunit type 1 TsaB [uncultured Algimonas sp.]|uniref:tRNA (adenosine(37)-N6)-threonylcarbamoyltransferase complex dimerization subunit type 1 TsaB n=1 Tax=uncultured Algimonas sp. TaxID=1547920 RepID=UPI002624519F|nr:tRNA (adenosine(37)-N6)-threonylcarbamoyltransferase complex dimerization subunit type 1 TsaB [uncultured Algimonas sp.]
MIVLGLDTTGPDCSACLVQGDAVLAYASERIGRGHAERLAPMVAELMIGSGVAPSRIGRIAVCTGPGSFTGLRVGLSYAKGFALPRRTPVLGIDALQVRAEELREAGDALVAVFRDIKRGQVFAAQYSFAEALDPPRAMTMDEAAEMADRLQAGLYDADGCDVRVMARMAASADPADHPAEPLYARAPDAKLPGGLSP